LWYTYLLLCDQKIFYIGITENVNKRLIKHRAKQSLYTLRLSEIKLVYCEKYKTKYESAKREKQLKGWSHAKKHMLIDKKINDPHCIELVVVMREN